MAPDTIADWSRGVWLAERTDSGGYVFTHRHWNGRAKAYVFSDPAGTWARCTMCNGLLRVPTRRLGRRMKARPSGQLQPSPWARRKQQNSDQSATADEIRQGHGAHAKTTKSLTTTRVTIGPRKGGRWQMSGGAKSQEFVGYVSS